MSLRRGLHIDDDDAPQKYVKKDLSAERKVSSFERGMDDMLFGGGPPKKRPAVQKPAQKPAEKPVEKPKATSSDKPTTTVKVPTNVGGYSANQNYNKNEPSIVQKTEQSSVVVSTKTLNIESKPQIKTGTTEASKVRPETAVDNKPSGKNTNTPARGKTAYEPPAEKRQENVADIQPQKFDDEVHFEDINFKVSGKNLFNKPGYLRKGKKVAEDYYFAEENPINHTSVDVVRPFEAIRAKMRKLNNFDFSDFEFPANNISCTNSTWKHAKEVSKSASFGKYVDPNDLVPGKLSSPQFLSLLSAIAELEQNTKRLIEDQKVNSNGFYLIRLFINSVWRYVAVDDQLPYVDEEAAGVQSNPTPQFQLSTALIEKAYAKVFGGSYDSFKRCTSRDNMLRDLTGAPVRAYNIDNPSLSKIISQAVEKNQVIVAVPTEKIASLGMNPNYSLNVIAASNRGLSLRNSWGTTEERCKTNFSKEGAFDLSSAQMRDCISHVLVAHINAHYFTSTIQSKHKSGFYSSYDFKVSKDVHGYFTVSQLDERLFPQNSGYQYSPFRVIIAKFGEEGSSFVNAGFTSASRNLDVQVNLTPGKYTAFCLGGCSHSYNLSFYGQQSLIFERVYTDKIPNYLSSSFENLNLSEGKKSELNRGVSGYLLYHQSSNLLLMTAQNDSGKATSATQDLSRHNIPEMNLYTGHDNEENYCNKVAHEVEEFKAYGNENRKWTVNLEPHEAFTWVVGSSERYDPNNLRKWGFK